MRVLRLRAYYEPEQTAAIHLDYDLSEAMAKNDIFCISYTPTPTRGVTKDIYLEYRKKQNRTQDYFGGHIIVNRFLMFREGKNPIQRAIRYAACSIREYQLGVKTKNIDLVYSSSTPPTQGMLSALVAKRLTKKNKKRVPFIYNIQDIFPDSLVNTGMTKKGSFIWKIGRKIENYTYSQADKIIVISEGFKRNIIEKGVPEEKIIVVSNWIDLDAVAPIDRKDNTLFDEYGIDPSKFVVLYAGNLGEAQGADVILDTAQEMMDNEAIQFVIFGGGARYDDIKQRVVSLGLKNVFITGLQPQERVSEVYSMGDVALITCKPGTGNAGMPSKTWSIMACNTPIVASFDVTSDLAEIIKESGAGLCVDPGDAGKLARAIDEMYKRSLSSNTTKINIREYALKTVSKDLCVQKYIETMKTVTGDICN